MDDLVPELADRQVLTRIDAPLDDKVPAHRPITVRDLLTFVWGLGAIMAPPGQYPIQRALKEAGLEPGPNSPPVEPDEWMKRIGSLPLAYQPGDKWLYHTGSDVLGVLMARLTGQPLAEVLAERVLHPLGMADTGFHVPQASLHRLAAAYRPDPETGALVLADDPRSSRWGRPARLAAGFGPLFGCQPTAPRSWPTGSVRTRPGSERVISSLKARSNCRHEPTVARWLAGILGFLPALPDGAR